MVPPTVSTVDDYLAALPASAREVLEQERQAIRSAALRKRMR
jgi:predicted N-acyltransferase